MEGRFNPVMLYSSPVYRGSIRSGGSTIDGGFVALRQVHNGTSESDYAGKDVREKVVLVASQPGDRRTAQDIRDVVSAVYGPVSLELVVEYLRALESIRVIETVK